MVEQDALGRRVRELWARYEPIYQEFTPYPKYFELRSVEFLLLALRLRAAIGPLRWSRVLEVGCGIGFSLQLWSLLASDVTGVDRPEAIAAARKLAERHPESAGRMHFLEGAGEDLSMLTGRFDLVVTQYAFEHFRDMAGTLEQVRRLLAPEGHCVHVLPNITDRHAWHIMYRAETPWWKRLRESVRSRGWRKTLKDPFGYTRPHDATRGDFESEHASYSLERRAAFFLRNGDEVVDFFSTRDYNWVLVTRPLPA